MRHLLATYANDFFLQIFEKIKFHHVNKTNFVFRIEPLLTRINQDPTVVVVPIIDNILEDTFEYVHDNDPSFFQVGGFTWSGHFTWINIPDSDQHKQFPTAPVKTPTMAGGLFAIDRQYFWNIGSYDDGMDGWGGENLEMSFRVMPLYLFFVT